MQLESIYHKRPEHTPVLKAVFQNTIYRLKNKQNIDVVDNPRLAMFNLYSAAKTLIEFQQEYSTLFLRYSSLPKSFAEEELEYLPTESN